MTGKSSVWLPALLVVVFALTRWPGLMPPNFSAAYALAFCAGAFFSGRMAWWLPLSALLGTDLVLNLYYQFVQGIDAFQPYQLLNYAAFGALILLGRSFRGTRSFLKLLCGGVLGAVLFYLLTNTGAWFFNPFHNPEYTKTLAGWIIALTKGTGGYPETWQFFRNTLSSGALFTALFVGAAKLGAMSESPADKEAAEDSEPEEDPAPAQPEEAKA